MRVQGQGGTPAESGWVDLTERVGAEPWPAE